ncbi:MAG TPA: RagB/SusD family nutrient uptake outer membrane protein, partial [Balneolaceae bacterium]|nr:RagB/SusD family nutrient uptake outer membrane protein [Balneolaceae bacterium]
MKFQKRTYLLVLVFIAFGLVSCKNNLKEHNPSGLTAQAVYSTPKGFETLVNAAYSYQRWVYGKFEGELMTEMGTDLWMSGHDNPDHSMMNYNNLQGTDSKLEQLWKELYAGINVCNYGITNINKSGLSPNLQTTREAELRFLRAEYYWLLTETWGPVPFSLKPTRSIKTKTSRTPVDSIYAQIFKDLKYADANLPVTQSDYGRATKPAAEAMLARMYLTRGENKEAFDMATKVINNYNFKLLPNYANLWKMDNQQNSEVIYAVTYSDNKKLNDTKNPILYPYGSNRGGNNLPVDFVMWYFQQPGMQLSAKYGRPFQRFMPTLHLLNLYNGKIDSRYH